MRVFLDSNILLDVELERIPFSDTSSEAMIWCTLHAEETFISWHTFTNVYYILSKQASPPDARQYLRGLLEWVRIAPAREASLKSCFQYDGDIEDILQFLCAQAAACDFIITRDPSGFKDSSVPALGPKEFLTMVNAQPKG